MEQWVEEMGPDPAVLPDYLRSNPTPPRTPPPSPPRTRTTPPATRDCSSMDGTPPRTPPTGQGEREEGTTGEGGKGSTGEGSTGQRSTDRGTTGEVSARLEALSLRDVGCEKGK